MIEQLDIRTLSFITVIFCNFFGIGLIVFDRKQSLFKGIFSIGLGMIFLGSGFLLMSFRDVTSDFVSVVFANISILFGVYLITDGLFKFRGYKGKLNYIGKAPLIFSSIFIIYYSYIEPNINARSFIASVYFAIQYPICAAALLFDIPKTDKKPYILTATTLITIAIFFVFRAIFTLNELPIESFMRSGLVHSMAFVAILLSVISLGFGIVWITTGLLQERLINLIRVDSLTNVLNRRGLEEAILKVSTLMIREEKPLSVIMVDIDHFKKVNDTYGHQIGDDILIQFSALLQSRVRKSDIVARYGGEEFLIVLPNTHSRSATLLAQKLCRRVETHDFESHSQHIEITASFGISTSQEAINWEKLVSRADEALYKAKQNGRNRVELI